MKKEEILKLFYAVFLKEAATGRIDCYRYFNIAFYTSLESQQITGNIEEQFPGVIVPTLQIKNKDSFSILLLEYIKEALAFYNENEYDEEIVNRNYFNTSEMISKEKYILCCLFANATTDDFNNPELFLKNRIEMFKHPLLEDDKQQNLGYIPSLEGNLCIQEHKSSIYEETPYHLSFTLQSELYNDTIKLPNIYLGITEENVFVYAIQSKEKEKNNSSYFQFVYDKLKRIDKGFTLSFIIPAIATLSLYKEYNFLIESYLIERWNAKRIAIYISNQYKKETTEQLKENLEKQQAIQNNLTEKFLRIYERICKHCEGITMTSEPYLIDSKMHINMSLEIISNRSILQEIFDISSSNKTQKFK